MVDDGGVNQWIFALVNAASREERSHRRQRCTLPHCVAAVAMAGAGVGACKVVEVHGRPQPRRLLVPAGGFDEAEGMDHYPCHMGLAVKGAAVPEETRRRYQLVER